MKRIKQILFTLLILFIVIQFIRPARNHGEQAGQLNIAATFNAPDTVLSLFRNACFDCHSNDTNYPWYSTIQPVGWLIEKDIRDGKAKLNFSELGSLSPRRQMSKWQNVENRIKDGTMPLPMYQLMHPRAQLTEAERQQLIDWVRKTIDALASLR